MDIFEQHERELEAAYKERVRSGEDARERERFRQRAEAEDKRMRAHGCYQSDEEE